MAADTTSRTKSLPSTIASSSSIQWHLNSQADSAINTTIPANTANHIPLLVPSVSHRNSKKIFSPTPSSGVKYAGLSHKLPPPTITTEGASPTANYSFRDRGEIREARDRRRKPWRKLLWVRQNYPDNHTDATFLESLQRNVNVRAYDFWPLVSDSTVIIQHLSSVVIFVTAFIAIYVETIDPMWLAMSGTILTVIGWLVWDEWREQKDRATAAAKAASREKSSSKVGEALGMIGGTGAMPVLARKRSNLGRSDESNKSTNPTNMRPPSRPVSRTSLRLPTSDIVAANKLHTNFLASFTSPTSPIQTPSKTQSPTSPVYLLSPTQPSAPPTPCAITPSAVTPNGSHYLSGYFPPPSPPPPPTRFNRRLSTLKSAILIYCTLLGLSPILKSLTHTTTKDSIWALSSWLFLVNLLCFDYGLNEPNDEASSKRKDSSREEDDGVDGLEVGGAGLAAGAAGGDGNVIYKKLPTSLSTTTALTASVVLASRLPSTTSVFILLLFSIQVFGLFPIFRRRLRHLSQPLHISLTLILVVLASVGVCGVLGWRWALAWFGLVGGGGGGAAWWLMGMQRYKNEIGGPWDPAKPVFRKRQWMESYQ